MKRCYKFVLVFLGSMFMFPALSNAQCSYERQAELSRIASNVQFSYNYLDNYNYSVNITNLTNDIYLKDDSENVINGVGEKQFEFYHGSTIRYEIYSKDSNCPNILLLTKYITLPSYNSFADYDECQKYPDFKYCQKWASTTVSFEQFDKALSEYKNELNNNENIEKDESTLMFMISDYLVNHTYMIWIIGTFLVIIIMLIVRKIIMRKKFGGRI